MVSPFFILINLKLHSSHLHHTSSNSVGNLMPQSLTSSTWQRSTIFPQPKSTRQQLRTFIFALNLYITEGKPSFFFLSTFDSFFVFFFFCALVVLNKVALTIELPSNAGSTAAAQKQLPILRNVVVSCEDQLAHWSRTNPPERNRKREREDSLIQTGKLRLALFVSHLLLLLSL